MSVDVPPPWPGLRLLQALPPEAAHRLALLGLSQLGRGARWLFPPPPPAPCRVVGIDFQNPVGLAAGLDKDGRYVDALGQLGFGFVEVGTVTPRPQPGNPPPRLFRLAEHRALINRLGFNNDGVDCLVARLASRRYQGVLGVNIGKNADTPLAAAGDDYGYCLERIYGLADYVAVNLSSPNTPNLRDLQRATALRRLVEPLVEQREQLAARHRRRVPLVIKLAPDLSPAEVEAIAQVLLECGIDGAIATNTTVARPGLEEEPRARESGGLSGEPLGAQATAVVAQLHRATGGQLPIIASGGVMTVADARAKREAGASLVQLYTGLIYRGPGLIDAIVRDWLALGAGAADSPRPSPSPQASTSSGS
ncbi:MAG: quinone-dependent dihydroorotate dehydrogenase [Candidatus Competibacterales bacterium]